MNGSVTFASSEGMSENCKKLSGSATKLTDQQKHTIPGIIIMWAGGRGLEVNFDLTFFFFVKGDTMYYKVELLGVSEAKYPRYSFTVTGTQEGRYVRARGEVDDGEGRMGGG